MSHYESFLRQKSVMKYFVLLHNTHCWRGLAPKKFQNINVTSQLQNMNFWLREVFSVQKNLKLASFAMEAEHF